jgi:hypothetical protein
MAAPYPLGLPMAKSKKHIRLRFQAVVIASQLPDNTAEALLVLNYARDLVVEFFDDPSGVSDNGGVSKPLAQPRVGGRFIPSSDPRRTAVGHATIFPRIDLTQEPPKLSSDTQ